MQKAEQKLNLEQTLVVLQAQVEVTRFRARQIAWILELEHPKELLELMEAEYLRIYGKPFSEGENYET
jgi:hypothetical protein